MTSSAKPRLAIVLPPREAFSPGAAGALGLLARRHAGFPGAFECTVYGPPPPTPPFVDVAFVPVRPAGWIGPAAARYAAGLLRVLRRDAPALVEVHNRPDLALALAAGCPGVPVTLILNNDPQSMRRAATPGERALLGRTLAGIACCSAFLAARLTEGVPTGAGDGSVPAMPAPVVLPNTLDLAELPPPAANRDDVVLFVGRVVADKGADGFVAACARALPLLPGWRAEMVGGDRFGPDNPETPFLRALRPRAAAAGVAMLGYRPHRDVMEAMARAAIVAVPSRWQEPFGLTAVEAMACGSALLCSNRGGLAEVTGDAAVPVDPDDPGGFARALVAVATDPARRAALADAGLRRAARFSLDVVGPQLDAWRSAARARFSQRAANPI